MDGYEIELVGGPADGEVRTIASDRRELRFYTPLSQSPRWEDDLGPPAEAQMEMIEVVYLRTTKRNSQGQRIYRHQQ